jgi:hypothetical protein
MISALSFFWALLVQSRLVDCDVRWVPPSSSDLAERKSVVPPSPPADRRREHRESAYFVVVRRGKAPPLSSPQHGGARFADTRTAFFLAERYA